MPEELDLLVWLGVVCVPGVWHPGVGVLWLCVLSRRGPPFAGGSRREARQFEDL